MDPWLDNAKMALVTLVVVGHAWTLLPDDAVTDHFYDFLYAWHVPAFVFVTGYLSRSFAYTPVRLWQLFRTVVVPYVIFECALALFRVYVGGEELEDLFHDPHWPMWYLAALFFWRLLTPVFRPMWGGLVVAVVAQPGGRALRRATPSTWRGSSGCCRSSCSGLKATPERLERLRARSRSQVAAVVRLRRHLRSSPPGPTLGAAPSGSTTAPATTRWVRRATPRPC